MDNVDVPAAEDPLAGVPELTSYLITDEEERIEALKLVADSVAQQRQLANKALLYSPLNLAILVGIVAQMVRYMIDHHTDYFVIGMSCLGLVMTFMAGTRWATKDYLYAAEEINWEWVGESDFLVTKFGDELIGTLVIEWVSGESRQKRKKAWRGFVKAWTVKQKYRHKGVGSALLEDAIKEAKKKGAEGLEFDDLHASEFHTWMDSLSRNCANQNPRLDSKRVLPSIYNSGFDKRDRMARELLEDLKQSSPSGGKRK